MIEGMNGGQLREERQAPTDKKDETVAKNDVVNICPSVFVIALREFEPVSLPRGVPRYFAADCATLRPIRMRRRGFIFRRVA